MEGNTLELDEQREQSTGDRKRSSIKFPYADLGEAITVAQAIHDNAGTQCDRTQLAAYLDQTASSGAFRLKVATASSFGLVKSSQGIVSLTSLGRDITDPDKAVEAKVKAFFRIPLYQAIYDEFKGRTLPPAVALERHMATVGVSKKQTDKARQVFVRSAEEAGFFKHGRSRLVEPAFKSSQEKKGQHEGLSIDEDARDRDEETGKQGDTGKVGGSGGNLPPLLKGLVEALPEPDSTWSYSERVDWLKLANQIFKMTYKSEANDIADISISLRDKHAE